MSIKEIYLSLLLPKTFGLIMLAAQSHEAGHMALFFCSTFLITLFVLTSGSHF